MNFTMGQKQKILKTYQKKQNSNNLGGMFSYFFDLANILKDIQGLTLSIDNVKI